jgi:L-ascorbate metabolism protein UlaG (beta-lactamase superfamily)
VSTKLTFLGAAGFDVVGPDRRILVDPFLTGNPIAPCSHEEIPSPDVILVSHAAHDHVGDAAAIAIRTGAPVVCGADVRVLLIDRGVPARQIRATVWGLVVEVAGVVVRPLECHHWSMATLSTGERVTGTPLAFLFETEPGVRIYHYGDTCLFDMRLLGELYRPTVGLLGCTDPFELEDPGEAPGRLLTGEMSPDEAARAAEMLGVELAVACHYLAATPDVAEFVRLVPEHDTTRSRAVLAPAVGETIVIDGAPADATIAAA